MSRSIWKGKFFDTCLLKNSLKKVWCRSSTIPFFLLGKKVLVYNGKSFKRIYISREKIGYKFGSFVFTRQYTKKIKIVKKKKN